MITDIARGEADLDTLKAGASLIPMAKITKVLKVVKAIGNVGKTGLKKGKEGEKIAKSSQAKQTKARDKEGSGTLKGVCEKATKGYDVKPKYSSYEERVKNTPKNQGKWSNNQRGESTFISDKNQTHYYPGQVDLWLKLIYHADTKKLLGAQMVGKKQVVHRVDALAVAIYAGLTTEQLGMLDFCYAPPFARAWDILNVAGNASK